MLAKLPPLHRRIVVNSRKNQKLRGRLMPFSGGAFGLDGDADWLLLLFGGALRCFGGINVVPAMLLNGTVRANVGKLWARTCVAASYPEASLIRVGSLNAVPKKL